MATRIPIFKDDLNFDDRQNKIFKDMERDMDRRRREWEDEVDRMRRDFFSMKPEREGKYDSVSDKFLLKENIDDAKTVIEKDKNGQPVFRARFDVREYKPEEVNVKMDTNKVMVHAKHEQKEGGSSVSREYNREVIIPREVDPLALQCTMSNDGILTVEAPLPVPQYAAINEAPAPQPIKPQPQRFSPLLKSEPLPPSQPSAFKPQPTFTSAVTSNVRCNTPPQTEMRSTPPIAKELSNKNKFKIECDIEDFKPEELTVKTLDKKVVVKARREERAGNRTSTKELSREYNIPDTVDPITVKAFFSEEGKLFIEAPYKLNTSTMTIFTDGGRGSSASR